MDYETKFYFGDIVIVEDDLIGVIVKTWINETGRHQPKGAYYEIYVRSFNVIKEYPESQIKRLIIGKELSYDN